MTSPIDALFAPENDELIILFNEKGEEIPFEQIALIPLENQVYAILKPARAISGVGEDEGLVFTIEKNERGEEYLSLVTEEKTIDEVFDVYDGLVAEAE